MAGRGQPRTGGRQKGTPNRATKDFQERMEELQRQGLDSCPIRVLMELASGKTIDGDEIEVDAAVRGRAAAELCSYIYPKRKAIEVSGQQETSLLFSVVLDDAPVPE
jgi:hypothetical protein